MRYVTCDRCGTKRNGAVAPICVICFERRSDICKNGHEYTPENTRITKAGWRKCHRLDCRKWNPKRSRRLRAG
jgi:hypothetical protein